MNDQRPDNGQVAQDDWVSTAGIADAIALMALLLGLGH